MWGIISKYESGTLKVARNALNIGEVYNPLSCHGNETVKLVLWGTFCKILLQRSQIDDIGWDIFFHHVWPKFGRVYDIMVFLICIIYFNPMTPALNCLQPTPISLAFFGIFQSEQKHKNKPYAQ